MRRPSNLSSLDFFERDVEDECCVPRDLGRGAAGAVAEVGGDEKFALLANLHVAHTQIPALNHLAHSQLERNRTIVEPTKLVDGWISIYSISLILFGIPGPQALLLKMK